MGKLVESGVLKTYLDKACPVYNYGICPYKDSLETNAWGFVWDASSPLNKTGGWEANRKEYIHIISDIISRPKYWPFLMFKSGEATLRELVLINIDGLFELPWVKYLKDSPPYENVSKYYPHELNELASSKQNVNALDIKFMDSVYCIVFIVALLIVILLIGVTPKNFKIISVIFLLILVVLNAFTTATFANVLTRLNSRVIWLIPVVSSIYIYEYLMVRLKLSPILPMKKDMY